MPFFNRYKATGDPEGFRTFMTERGVAPSVFLRYVGNRFNVMFHMAGVIIEHHRYLLEYLERLVLCM